MNPQVTKKRKRKLRPIKPHHSEKTIQRPFKRVPVGSEFYHAGIKYKKLSMSAHYGVALPQKGTTKKFNEYVNVLFVLNSSSVQIGSQTDTI